MTNKQFLQLIETADELTSMKMKDTNISNETRIELSKFRDSISHIKKVIESDGKITSEEYENSGPFKFSDYANLTAGSSV